MAPGTLIRGMAFRMYSGATGTYTGATWNSYDIRIGQGVAPSQGSTRFASNLIGGSTLIRSGSLTIRG